MPGEYLLDTNIVLAIWLGEPRVLQRVRSSGALFIPGIVIGELYFGAFHSGRVQENLERVDQIATHWSVLPCDGRTAKLYGESREALSRKGKPIPENDIWIAALARQHELVLASRDQHFRHVAEVQWEKW